MQRYVTEFIGTFFLVLTIGFAVNLAGNLAPLAIGSALMVMIFMGGHISGAHYNPAVSLAVLLRGKLAVKDFVPYLISQVAGALAASAIVYVVLDKAFGPAPGDGYSAVDALIVEVLYTFALCLVVLNVATADKTAGNSFYGLAIGFTVLTGAFAVGAISGGAFNPAVGTGPLVFGMLVGKGALTNLWIYWVGPLAGGALAAAVFKLQDTPADAK
jgi:aquaporin Z